MNFVFVSPNFPQVYWNFCERLVQNGVRVLGVGDCAYDDLDPRLRHILTEYYKVNNLGDYEEMFRAVAFLSFKYGKIDWLESNNEFWLEQDARLREDFNIKTGMHLSDARAWRSKSSMKSFYERAGVPSARCLRPTTLAAARAFVEEVGGYPVFAKPDVGVGADGAHHVNNDAELEALFESGESRNVIIEECVRGDIMSYDAILDSHGKPLFESSCLFPPSMSDVVQQHLDMGYCVLPEVPEKLLAAGRACARAFGVTSRFIHFEFFRLSSDQPGLGKRGDFVGLEANMRPAGAYTPDMMNVAHEADVYSMWADMVCYDELRNTDVGTHGCCVYAGRRDGRAYAHSHDEIMSRYYIRVRDHGRMPDAISNDMGNDYYVARVRDEKAAREFMSFVFEPAAPEPEPKAKASAKKDAKKPAAKKATAKKTAGKKASGKKAAAKKGSTKKAAGKKSAGKKPGSKKATGSSKA